jgi:hypothetical protein
MSGRVCAYGRCSNAAKPRGKFCSSACRTADWKARTNYVKPPARDAGERERRQTRRNGGPRGIELPWRRTVRTLAKHLAAIEGCADSGPFVHDAESILAPALSDRQRARLERRA